MKYIIDEEVVKNSGYTLPEFLILLFYSKESNYNKVIRTLKSRDPYINLSCVDNTLLLSPSLREEVETILLDSEKVIQDKRDWYTDIALKIRDIYPAGKKPGTFYSFRGSIVEIAKKLKTLKVKYKFDFTEEQAIKATKDYVASFNGDYTYMKLLKYFILKVVNDADGNAEIKSDFMSLIENQGSSDATGNNWVTELK